MGDGQEIVCAGYANYDSTAFTFVADEGTPYVWRLDSIGNIVTEKDLSVEGMGQVAKIRKDASSGFIACSTAWGSLGGQDVNVVALVKLTNDLDMDWSQTYGLAGGNSQVFDMLVDSQSKQEVWRKTYGQPRGFDARYIHENVWSCS